ncbi:hypothetical protein [Rhizobium leguminosarum]|uniref:hypothetical protein n=1 Tax=Rhizobium leguminosarum TaxID=384 RepID=UPI000FEC6FCE|nr:hypothetical protein [Rhizobium leguminosarum]RWX36645.1 hypothetical protein EHI43_08510 [Rhizobium leguminosarum]
MKKTRAQQAAQHTSRRAQSSRNSGHWLGRLTRETFFVVLGAIVGGLVSQFTLPALAPYAELYAFTLLDINIAKPNFLVLADEGEIKAKTSEPGDLLTISRQFCGWSKYCLQVPVKPSDLLPPDRWEVVSDTKEIMDLLVSEQTNQLNAAFVNKHSKVPGFYRLDNISSEGYIGFGYGCYQRGNDPEPLIGRYPAYWGSLDMMFKESKSPNSPHDEAFPLLDGTFYGKFGLYIQKKTPTPSGTPGSSGQVASVGCSLQAK